MTKITLLFGLPMLIAGGMIMPGGLRIGGLLAYTAVMLVLLPISGWWLFATQLVVPTAGRTRLSAVFNLWIGGTLLGVSAIFWIASLLSYDPSGLRYDPSGHVLIPYAPKV